MEKIAGDMIFNYYNELPYKIIPLGGGFYGRVFLGEKKKSRIKSL